MGGAVARYGDDHAAYRNREAAFAYNLLARWADPAEDKSCRAWARSAHEAMERFGTGAAYLNFLPAEGEEPVRAAFGADAYARLVALKDRLARATCSGSTTTSVPAAKWTAAQQGGTRNGRNQPRRHPRGNQGRQC